jgi:hypothetical protein
MVVLTTEVVMRNALRTAAGWYAPLAIAAATVQLTGCVTEKMQTFVGRDVQSLIVAYGPPTREIEMPGGAKAFQWERTATSTTPVSARTMEKEGRDKGSKITQTTVSGGQTTTTRCLYTFVADWTPPLNAWIVTSFNQPSYDCSLGDINNP